MPLELVDFHCHLDLYPNFPELVKECEHRKIYTLAVTTTPRAWQRNHMLAKQTKYVRAALGLHPQLVGELGHEVDVLCKLIPEARYIGEIGLDGSPQYSTNMGLQKNVLGKILHTCAKNGGRIMSLHSRRATKEVLDLLEAHKKSGTPILHWFSGTLKDLERAIALGCWFSVGPKMLQTQKGVELIKNIPQNRLLTETDGPFTQEKGEPSMPWHVSIAIKKLSVIWEQDLTNVQNQILANLKAICK
ncbi:hydrolase TatD [Legionella quinlivanii]|uniref:Hydrolase TatD n=1 Tax=Legionella quinlivanii TaxID=45073 RepID=A0A364LF38_9GAMM|nr:Qat anti-phage system TatD family nuclease QatD [Legionella quinlivanii]RAP34404.1 hydrolase TatD [Legionella quinlivanii]